VEFVAREVDGCEFGIADPDTWLAGILVECRLLAQT
jgi:hypothetical protein